MSVCPEPETLSESVPDVRLMIPEFSIILFLSEMFEADVMRLPFEAIMMLLPDIDAELVVVWLLSEESPIVTAPVPFIFADIRLFEP